MINFKIEIVPEVECLYTAEIGFNIFCPNPFIISPGSGVATKYSSNSDLRKTGVTLFIVTD